MQPYENSYAWIMRLRDGKVVDGTAFYDSISFNDLWSQGATLIPDRVPLERWSTTRSTSASTHSPTGDGQRNPSDRDR